MSSTYTPPRSPNGTATLTPTMVAPKKSPNRLIVIAAAIVVVCALVAFIVYRFVASPAPTLVTVPVTQGPLVRSVTASGTVNPQDTISVGSQISGTISEIDADYNSVVHTGQVLARIDPTSLQASLDQAQAQLAQTQATAREAQAGAVAADAGITVQRATADAAAENVNAARANAAAQTQAISAAQSNVDKAQSALTLAQQTLSRDASLLSQGYVAQSQVDTDRSAAQTAAATLVGAQASLAQARSVAVASTQQANQAIAQSQSQSAQNTVASANALASQGTAAAQSAAIGIQAAQVRTAQYNLDHATITSPVNGTVISRGVSIGQTVASSFSTPTLFTIARDLSKMEVDVAVGEPDIGSVKAGEPVTFTVLAYPNTTFNGTVFQVRQNPTVVSNVVTYDTVVYVSNKNGLLRPGMTANALIQTQHVNNALIVPTQALEWRPSAAIAAAYHLPARSATGTHATGTHAARGTSGGSQFGQTLGAGAATIAPGSRGLIFVQRAGTLQAVPVTIDLTAATQVAVTPLHGTLTTSDAVVTGDSSGVQSHTAGGRAPTLGQQGMPAAGAATRAVR